MNLLQKIVGIVLVLLLPLGVRGQSASVAEKEMTVAERNAAQGFNDTIDRLDPDAEQRLWEMMDNHMLTEQDMQMNLFKFGCANTLLRYVERAIAPTQIKYNWPEGVCA